MLNRLIYNVVFPSTGKSFGANIDFETGLTAITGANECGKSLILEIIRFCLFGTKALRGAAGDYKKLKASLIFTVKGFSYKVDREKGGAELFIADGDTSEWKTLAAGASVVNTKIPEILGYGLAVFDTANACNQGDIEALGNMKPTERKRMVDSVIGISVVDDLIKYVGDEALSLQREIDAIAPLLQEPVAPTVPEGYEASSEVAAKLAKAQALQNERNVLLGQLKIVLSAPTPPEMVGEETAANLRVKQAARIAKATEINNLTVEIGKIPDAKFSAEQLDAFEAAWPAAKAWDAYQARLAALGPKPELTAKEIQTGLDGHALFNSYKAVKAKFDAHRIECPACKHEFGVDLTDEEKALLKRKTSPAEPKHSLAHLQLQKARQEAWAAPPAAVPQADAPELSQREIQAERDGLNKAKEKVQLQQRLEGLAIEFQSLPDVSKALEARLIYEAAYSRYQRDVAVYAGQLAEQQAAQAKLDQIPDQGPLIFSLTAALSAAHVYEAAAKKFATDLETYQKGIANLNDKRHQCDQWRRGKEAMILLKARVKQYVIPSLNVVASQLLQQMTGGQRQFIDIDDEFNIRVDGQELNTLSGSGKAVANLATRIGLGQVLTNAVFPVFMADEIDAAMDADRAGNTAECLGNLTKRIRQIVLVSHKKPEADHYVEL